MPATPIEEALASLQAHYAERINAAVAVGRMDLVRDLANDYEDEALELILTMEGDASIQPGHGPIETLEFAPTWPHWPGRGMWRFGFWRQRKR
jgi:hypothetical protein